MYKHDHSLGGYWVGMVELFVDERCGDISQIKMFNTSYYLNFNLLYEL